MDISGDYTIEFPGINILMNNSGNRQEMQENMMYLHFILDTFIVPDH